MEDQKLVLTVDCQYLAEKIKPDHVSFYVELIGLEKLEFERWSNPVKLPNEIVYEPKEIFQAELEILSANIDASSVRVCCNQHDLDYDYCGGNLSVNCKSIKIYNQDKNELTIGFIDKICNEYWNRVND